MFLVQHDLRSGRRFACALGWGPCERALRHPQASSLRAVGREVLCVVTQQLLIEVVDGAVCRKHLPSAKGSQRAFGNAQSTRKE